MMKLDVVKTILGSRFNCLPAQKMSHAFAPSNIALCKYWGKRDEVLNLPVTASLSISLGRKGASVTLSVSKELTDTVILNNVKQAPDSSFYVRLIDFLNLFRTRHLLRFCVDIISDIPIAAGLASSACGFAACVKALDALFGWQLNLQSLSILARLGSGSAARSVADGFMEWHAGERPDGMDSYAEPLFSNWSALGLGLHIIDRQAKLISSRVAMQRTVTTSQLYTAWPQQVQHDLPLLKQAIQDQDFHALGRVAEANALAMHATMLSAWPPINYALPETLQAIKKIWMLRDAGLPIYFTQDAGPNLKLIFLEQCLADVQQQFQIDDVFFPLAIAGNPDSV